MDRKYVMTGLGYAILGLCLGIYMAASQNHVQHVTHAHIMLVGFVLSFAYGVCHKLWLNNATTGLAKAQFYVHQAGVIVLFLGLFLFYGDFVALEKIDPVLALASITVFAGLVMMKVLFIKSCKSS